MDDVYTQREYGAAVEAHYGLKNVTKVSMPTNEHDEPLVLHISMLVSKEDIKGIAARFAGEVPAKTTAAKELDILVEEFINIPVLNPGRTRVDVMAEIQAVAERVTSEAPPKTSIGELTVKLDTSLVQDAIREMLEPGAMYLPASAVEWLALGVRERLVELGGVISK